MIELFPDRYSQTQQRQAPGSPTPDSPPDPQLALFSEKPAEETARPRMVPVEEAFLQDLLEDERTTNRTRETFLASVIIHLLLVLLVVTQPNLFRSITQKSAADQGNRQVTLLYEPPDLPKVKVAPKTPILSDANRKAQQGAELPPPPRLQYQPPAPLPPSPAPKMGEENKLVRQLPRIGLPEFPETPKEAPKPRPTLEPVPPPPVPSPQAQLTIPEVVPPGRGVDAILRGMAKQQASGRGQGITGGGGGYPEYDPQNPNLNMPGPQILSDTMGVDFNPYLLRILSLVRRNWYTVIPEIARLGKQGRVVLEFTILRDGTVPDLTLRAGSGTESLDGAALASIRMSSPFPSLPPEFPGQDIRLRFIYLYNLRVD
jgi:TonB family protein